MKIKIAITSLLFIYSFSYAQIKGQCVSTSGIPLPFVNIAVNDTDIGTVTNAEGFFVLDDEKLTENTNLIISHIGFQTKSIFASNNSEIVIVLSEMDFQLDEVEINASTYNFKKEKRIGNNVLSPNVVTYFSTRYLGTEIGKYFKVPKRKNYKVEKIRFNVQELVGYKSVTFRINFYEADSEEAIQKTKYNTVDFIVDVSEVGDVNVDLTSERLVFENDFLVSIEWIAFNEKEGLMSPNEKRIYFASNVFCGPNYYRSNNLSTWRAPKVKYNMCLGMQVYVKQ